MVVYMSEFAVCVRMCAVCVRMCVQYVFVYVFVCVRMCSYVCMDPSRCVGMMENTCAWECVTV